MCLLYRGCPLFGWSVDIDFIIKVIEKLMVGMSVNKAISEHHSGNLTMSLTVLVFHTIILDF